MKLMRKIPLVEPWLADVYANEVKDQVLSGFLGPGKRVQEFSDQITKFTGAPHCLLTVSGTVALSVAAIALRLEKNDEILVPAYGVISTVNAFASIGLNPKLVDIERRTGCLCMESLKQIYSKKTKAVCFVNFTGYTGQNLVEIKKFCDENKVPLIEDSACALGHQYQGKSAGLFGNVGIYSFSVPKIVTTGQGGAIVTKDQRVYENAAAYIDQGDLEWRKTNLNRSVGTNLRFNDIQAALGCCQIKNVEKALQKRRIVFLVLKDRLGSQLYSVPGDAAPLHSIVFPKDPLAFREKLTKQGIMTGQFYRKVSTHPAYRHLNRKVFPQASFWEKHAVYLPFGLALDVEDAHYIAESIKNSKEELYSL